MINCMFYFFRGEQPDHVQERLPLPSLQRNRIQVDTSKDLCYQTDMFFSGVEKLKNHDELHFYLW